MPPKTCARHAPNCACRTRSRNPKHGPKTRVQDLVLGPCFRPRFLTKLCVGGWGRQPTLNPVNLRQVSQTRTSRLQKKPTPPFKLGPKTRSQNKVLKQGPNIKQGPDIWSQNKVLKQSPKTRPHDKVRKQGPKIRSLNEVARRVPQPKSLNTVASLVPESRWEQ